MIQGLIKRIERLEAQKPESVVILAEKNGDCKEIPLHEIFTEDGERRPEFEGYDFMRVVSGNNLNEFKLILDNFFGDGVIC